MLLLQPVQEKEVAVPFSDSAQIVGEGCTLVECQAMETAQSSFSFCFYNPSDALVSNYCFPIHAKDLPTI